VVSILRDGRPVDLFPAWWHGAACWILRRSQLSARVLLGLRKRLAGLRSRRLAQGGEDTCQAQVPACRSV
jgi:hypothetical protein